MFKSACLLVILVFSSEVFSATAQETSVSAAHTESLTDQADRDRYEEHSTADSLSLPLQAECSAPPDSLVRDTSAGQAHCSNDTLLFTEEPGRLAVNEMEEHSVQKEIRYPGIAKKQDRLAREMMRRVHLFDWREAEKIALTMQELEKKDTLPALSYLLLVSMKIFQVQNNEYADERAKKRLLRQIDDLSPKGIELAPIDNPYDSLFATNLLINGGIRGFRATLKMDESLIESAREGLRALRLMEQMVKTDPSIKDGYLGLGIFHCALSKAPAIVKFALNLSGHSVSLSKGLDYLRKASAQGHYTSDIAKQYLIQFLDPYYGHSAKEKSAVFDYFKQAYPQNPYYTFLELDEYLCFNREKLAPVGTYARYRDRIRAFEITGESALKYATLVKYQYRLVNPFPAADLRPDPGVDLREFSYYPSFLRALETKLLLAQYDQEQSSYLASVQFIESEAKKALDMLSQSDMGPGRRGFYRWHIRDALRL